MCVKSDARPQLPFNSEANEVMSKTDLTVEGENMQEQLCWIFKMKSELLS